MDTMQSENLADYEENLELFASRVLDFAIYLLDPSGQIRSWNAGAERLYGYSAQEIIGCHFSVCYTSEDRAIDQPRRALEMAALNGSFRQEGFRERKDHTSFWAAATITALKDKVGNLRGFAKLTHNITRHKSNEAKYLALFENSHDAVLLTRPADGAILKANSAASKLFGYAEQELLNKHRDDLLDMADPRFVDAWAERAATGAVAAKLTFIRKGGEQFEGRVASKLFMDENEQQVSCTTIHDITEQKRTEEALRASEEKFRTLFANMTEGFALGEPILDEQDRPVSYRYLVVNEAFYIQTGIPRGIQGLPIRDYLPQLEQYWIDRYCAVALTGRPDRFDAYNADTRRHYDVYVFSPSPGRFAILFRDITERKRAEQQIRASEARFHATFEQLAVGLAHVSQEGLQLRVNAKYSSIVGYDRQTLEHMYFQEITHPDGLEKELENMAAVLAGSISGYSMEKRYIRKDGTAIWCNLTVSLVRTATGEPEYFVAVAEDIQARKEAEQALKESEEKYRATFEHAPLGIAEVTVDGRVIEVNAKLVEMLAYTRDEIAHLTIADVTHPGDLEKSLSNFEKLAKGEAESYVMEKRYLRKDCSLVWVNVTASLVSTHGKPQYMILTVEDISSRKKIEEDLKRAMEASYHQANHDMLTGLANRASFHDRLQEALAYARRDGHLVAIHMLDLDRFKYINDTLGHHIGDLLLKDVAKRIKSHVRITDLVARLGGDEFVVIQTHLADPVAAGVLAAKLVDDLGRKYVLEDQEVHSRTSIGIAVFPNDSDDPEDLIKHADLALYEAKHRGRFNYQFYRQELGAAALEAQRLDLELARALREHEFCLHYQPQFDLKSGRMTGIEALLRWQHPTRGKLAASQFILDAEHAKLMLPIGEWTLQTACRQHKAWVDAGLVVPLTLNLSAIQLRDPRLLETLKRILEDTGLPASMLQLEMRESVLWDQKVSKYLLHQMKESGLRVALDDFGAEVTTLPILDEFPLDALKPGHRLVKSLSSHPREAAILAAIIGVAHDLNIAVCADGVETDDQFNAVKDQGCDSAKGYWLSLPLDAQQMQQRIDVELTH